MYAWPQRQDLRCKKGKRKGKKHGSQVVFTKSKLKNIPKEKLFKKRVEILIFVKGLFECLVVQSLFLVTDQL